mmetsp:Transcript_58956/g.137957  ORF Transcript_58956/g.137957 Transcript_58956/m.137957 type:complete len:275 (+) Transcript_58956:196-1020(+)
MIRRAKQNLPLAFRTFVDKTDLLVSNVWCRRRCLVGAAGDEPCCHQKSEGDSSDTGDQMPRPNAVALRIERSVALIAHHAVYDLCTARSGHGHGIVVKRPGGGRSWLRLVVVRNFAELSQERRQLFVGCFAVSGELPTAIHEAGALHHHLQNAVGLRLWERHERGCIPGCQEPDQIPAGMANRDGLAQGIPLESLEALWLYSDDLEVHGPLALFHNIFEDIELHLLLRKLWDRLCLLLHQLVLILQRVAGLICALSRIGLLYSPAGVERAGLGC